MRIAICAKSSWTPALRREHALARAGAGAGADVVFVESPRDVRSLRRPVTTDHPPDGVSVIPRWAPVPGHRGTAAASVDSALLRRRLIRLHRRSPLDAVVVQMPWQWAAVRSLPVERVFDAADDWTALIPQRGERIRAWYRTVAAEADRVVVAAPGLGRLFPGVPTHLVPNGVEELLSAGAPTPVPGRKRMTYVGTLSERFDTGFVAGLMATLPDWTLDLYGPCQYAGSGGRPSPELSELLAAEPRVRWHGSLARKDVPQVLDAADVLLVPNRRERSGGQSSMKMLDYAARGRPVVSTFWDGDLESRCAPGTSLVASSAEAARVVAGLAEESADRPARRVAWAREQSWQRRWDAWAEAVLGEERHSRDVVAGRAS